MLRRNLRYSRNTFRFAGVPIVSRAFLKWLRILLRSKITNLKKPKSLDEVILRHFSSWSEEGHRTRAGIEIGLRSACKLDLLVETGTSAWGCDSSRLFDSVIKFTNGLFYSVDLRPEASAWLTFQTSPRTYFFVDDSVNFLRNKLGELIQNKKIDLVYLDSFDLDLSNPSPSEVHCLNEFKSVLKHCKAGSIVIIDDTPASINEFPSNLQSEAKAYKVQTGRYPGKGSLVLDQIKDNSSFKVIWHSENLVIQIMDEQFQLLEN